MSKHTPGPWSVVEHDHAICIQTESPSKTKYGASRYAALVAAAEREECAKVCDSVVIEHPGRADLTADQCAAAIRARGNT